MTKEELGRLHSLNMEIEREKRRLRELRSAAESVTSPISGLPHVTGDFRRSEDVRIMLSEQEELVTHMIRQSVIEYDRLIHYIANVGDPLMREILRLRFINGLPWLQVAASIGGGNTAEGVRKACYRFLDKS